ncbi:Hypothetical protein MVR_LOCUS57 [uncultured virus]|nr:Hypothetical protein MVR_LOCUS57 [uncultured virus]
MPELSDYYELCGNTHMPSFPFFPSKLEAIQAIVPKRRVSKDAPSQSRTSPHFCNKCSIKYLYKLGNIVWPSTLLHLVQQHQSYPSEYFVKVILATDIIMGRIVNPPLELSPNLVPYFYYISLHYNKLLIIDALMHQGSSKRYSTDNTSRYIYSEHSGAIQVRDLSIHNIIIATDTDRIDTTDTDIYLPINSDVLALYPYIFHTHPNTDVYAGRFSEGIAYEFPSANDLLNFIKYHNEGQAQASIIVAPEGIYVIRPIKYTPSITPNLQLFYSLRRFILKLEKAAVFKYQHLALTLSEPDIFHNNIGADTSFIHKYNRFIEPANLWVEYYPRVWRNEEWTLRQINLPYLEPSKEDDDGDTDTDSSE